LVSNPLLVRPTGSTPNLFQAPYHCFTFSLTLCPSVSTLLPLSLSLSLSHSLSLSPCGSSTDTQCDDSDDDCGDGNYLHPSLMAPKKCSRLEELMKVRTYLHPQPPPFPPALRSCFWE